MPPVPADGARRFPQVDAWAGDPDQVRVEPLFVAPGLVLLGALAVYSGYHSLHLFPGGSFRSSELVFALLAAPATFALTRYPDARRAPGVRIVARVSADVGLVLGLTVAVDHDAPFRGVLGVTSLILAVALVSLAYATERRRLPTAGHD